MTDATREARIARLTGSCHYDYATAAKMVEGTKWLTEDEFAAHADYLAERRAVYKNATDQGVQDGSKTDRGSPPKTPVRLPPQQTDKPAPMAGQPAKVKETLRQQVRADIQSYMDDFFDVPDEG